ncbi:MAG: DNA polymerase IV [Candidatus Colwellbacteria bacterium]|nr:DNA polymerase IV [Candidatus Colwellbacteria bacterium]
MRIIAHIDMDAFFAAVEERDHSRLRGKPIVVGADPMEGEGRGVVATANYAARAYGIHSALPIARAWRLAEKAKTEGKPEVVFIQGHMDDYREASEKVVGIIREFARTIEQVSVDEAYIDLSFAGSYAKAEEMCRTLKEKIGKRERLTASVGIGPNKLVAKIASDAQKPDGLTVVREQDAAAFLAPLSLRVIPGIGPKTEALFYARGARTVKDLRSFSKRDLVELLGKIGADIYRKARAEDESPVEERGEAKSIGEQETFLKDTRDADYITGRMRALAEGVHARFTRSGYASFRTIVVTVRFADFETVSRSRTLPEPAANLDAIQFEALRLLLPFLEKAANPKKKLVRLIGVRVEKLDR